jgi:HPt (histidine-containing phosphotransfer) domain-containing protein
MATTPPTTPPALSKALDRLWVRFLPEIEHRISMVEIAAQAQYEGSLTQEQREAAHAAAHKLAGTLGTFGLHRGTEVARQIEHALAEETPLAAGTELSSSIAEIRVLIDRRK